MEVEQNWFVKQGPRALAEGEWYTVYHRCGRLHIGSKELSMCFVPTDELRIIPHVVPYCGVCSETVPDRVVGFLRLCRWKP